MRSVWCGSRSSSAAILRTRVSNCSSRNWSRNGKAAAILAPATSRDNSTRRRKAAQQVAVNLLQLLAYRLEIGRLVMLGGFGHHVLGFRGSGGRGRGVYGGRGRAPEGRRFAPDAGQKVGAPSFCRAST